MRGERIDHRHLLALLLVLLTGKVYLPYLHALTRFAATAAWQAQLVSAAAAAGAVAILVDLARYARVGTIVDIARAALGRLVGGAAGLVLAAHWVLVVAVITRQYGDALILTTLTETPMGAVVFSLLAVTAYLTYLGLEVLGRVSLLMAVLALANLAVLAGAVVPIVDARNLFPFWGRGVDVTAAVGLRFAPAYSEILFLGLCYPALAVQGLRRSAWLGLAAGTGIIMLSLVVSQLVFPWPLAEQLELPLFEVAKTVSFGRYLERSEPLFTPVWMMAVLTQMAVATYAAARSAALALGVRDYRSTLPFILAAVMWIAFLPPDAAAVDRLAIATIWSGNGLLLAPTLLLIWLAARLRLKPAGRIGRRAV